MTFRWLDRVVYPAFATMIIVLIWHASIIIGIFRSSMLPSPAEVLFATLDLIEKGILFQHIQASILRVFAGFCLAVIVAVPFGLLLGTYKKLMRIFDPLIQLLRPISPIAWIPLAILWFGIGDVPAIFIICITAFFPMLIASVDAVKNIDPVIIRSAKNFGTEGLNMLIKVILPAAFPHIMVGMRISLSISWVIIVAAEMVGMRSGLGFLILDARNFLRTDIVIVCMIVIGVIGLLLDRLFLYLEGKVRQKWAYSHTVIE